MSAFGRILSNDQLEDAVIATLRRWVPTYLREIETQLGLQVGYYQRPGHGAYTVRSDFDKFPEDMLPLVVVTCPGILDDPPKNGRGQSYSAKYQINATAVTTSVDSVYTRRFSSRLSAAVRTALVQHQSLDHALNDTVTGIDWIGQRGDQLPDEDDRTIWASQEVFSVDVDSVMLRRGGPVAPTEGDDDDVNQYPPDTPTVQLADVKLTKESVIT